MEALAFQLNQKLLSPFGGGGGGAGNRTLGQLVTTGSGLAIVVAGTLFLLLILYGGFTIIRAAGKNDPQSYTKAQGYLTYTILGFILIVTAFLFIRIIEQIFGVNFITQPKL